MNGHVTKKGERYYVVLELGVDPVSGKRRRKWHSGYARKKEATAALAELVTSVNAGTYVAPTKLTLGEYLAKWLPSIRSTVRPNTYGGYKSMVDKHLVPGLGTTPLRQLDRQTLSSWYATLSESGRADEKGGLSPRTVRLVHTVLHRALKDAVADGLVARNAADGANVPAKVRSATSSWTAEQATAFLASTGTQRLHAAYVLAANTGLRRSEVLGLRWADVDLERQALAVRQTIGLDGYRPYIGEPKTSKSRRVVALDAGTVAALKSHLTRQKAERMAAGPAWTDRGLVFARQDGEILHPQVLSDAFERAVKATGLPAIGFHGLRHSHASLGLAAGIPLQIMSERLGHHSVALTGDVYSHSLPSQHRAAAEQIAALMGS